MNRVVPRSLLGNQSNNGDALLVGTARTVAHSLARRLSFFPVAYRNARVDDNARHRLAL